MKATRVLLIAHGLTHAQRGGRFPSTDDTLYPAAPPGFTVAGTLLCAPELRTRDSAAHWGGTQVDHALCDLDYGHWEGQALSVLAPEALTQWMADPHSTVHGGEAFSALCARIGQWLDARPTGHWVAVTHPAVLRAACVHGLQMPLACAAGLDIAPWARITLSRSNRWRVTLGE